MTGGFTGLENTGSTEVFTEKSPDWSEVSPLPKPRNGLRAATVNNVVYIFGKNLFRSDGEARLTS